MSYRRHPSPDVHWYMYSYREARERWRFAAIIALPAFMLMGFVFLGGAVVSLLTRPVTVEVVLTLLLGIMLPIIALAQGSETMVRTGDLRSDDKGIYVQKGLTDQRTLIPYEVMSYAQRKQRRRYSGVKFTPVESFTIIPVRGVRDPIRSLVGFEYGFGFRPVIIVSQFHENSDVLLERIESGR